MSFPLPELNCKRYSPRLFLKKYGNSGSRILSIGAGIERFSQRTTYVDIQALDNIDAQGDAHSLPFAEGSFDIVILKAMLQYCRRPAEVVAEAFRVLVPGGLVYVDAPFMQPYCPNTPDLYRFSQDGLRHLFAEKFSIVECEASIYSAAALAYYLQNFFGNYRSRYLRYPVKLFISLLVWPLSRLALFNCPETAGAFYIVGKKTSDSKQDTSGSVPPSSLRLTR